jgi:hypothetical protein
MNVWSSPGLTWKEARDIIRAMRETIDRYGFITITDFYDITSSNVTRRYWMDKTGWTSLKYVFMILGLKGWKIVLPPVQEVSYYQLKERELLAKDEDLA